jgi:hypothetical protein
VKCDGGATFVSISPANPCALRKALWVRLGMQEPALQQLAAARQ